MSDLRPLDECEIALGTGRDRQRIALADGLLFCFNHFADIVWQGKERVVGIFVIKLQAGKLVFGQAFENDFFVHGGGIDSFRCQ